MIVPTSSQQAAIALSRALFQLARPADNPNDVARFFCPWLQNPETGAWALNVPEMALWIAPDADEHGLDAIFQPWIDNGLMDAAELTALQSAIVASRGQQIVPLEFLALLPTFAALAMDDNEATAAGWFEAGEDAP